MKEPNPSRYKSFRRRRSLRLPHFDYRQPWVVYHVIIGTYQAHPHFTNAALNGAVLQALRTLSQCYGYAILTFCLMPDHLHLLVQAREGCRSLEAFIGAFKSVTTRLYWERGGKGRLWQRGFYDRFVRRSEDLDALSEYIRNNPVRKGLAEAPEDYQWSGQWDEPLV